MRQLSFDFTKNYKKEFGGSLLLGKRKSKRPLSTKHPLHLVLKSSYKGVFNPSNKSLRELIQKQSKRFGIKIYDYAVNWSHIHLIIRIKDRTDYLKFIRAITSIIALRAKEFDSKFDQVFTLRPFTRILSWGRDFRNALSYQVLNQLEAVGLARRTKKKKKHIKSKRSFTSRILDQGL
jgi:REP element-mobilizing transposase RayT